MSTKTMTLAEQVKTEYKTGPDASGKLRSCIACHEPLEAEQRWLKITRPGEYSIAVHTSCLGQRGAKLGGEVASERRPGAFVGVRP